MTAMATVPVSFGTQQPEVSTFYGSFSDEARYATATCSNGHETSSMLHIVTWYILIPFPSSRIILIYAYWAAYHGPSLASPDLSSWNVLNVFLNVWNLQSRSLSPGEDPLPQWSKSWKFHATFATSTSTPSSFTAAARGIRGICGIGGICVTKWAFATTGTAEGFLSKTYQNMTYDASETSKMMPYNKFTEPRIPMVRVLNTDSKNVDSKADMSWMCCAHSAFETYLDDSCLGYLDISYILYLDLDQYLRPCGRHMR